MTRKCYERLVIKDGKIQRESVEKRNSLVNKVLRLSAASALALTIGAATKAGVDLKKEVFDAYINAKESAIHAIEKNPSHYEVEMLREETKRKKRPKIDYTLEGMILNQLDEWNDYTINKMGEWVSELSAYSDFIHGASIKYNINEDFFTALLTWEGQGNPKAYSPKGASGIAQLMPQMARQLGLRVDKTIDERMNPEKAIGAAARLIADAKKRWGKNAIFILADYNLGGPELGKRVKKQNGVKQIQTLPKQTKKHAASVGALYRLLEEEKISYEIKPSFKDALENTFEHRLNSGETVYSLSRKYRVSIKDIKFLNPEIRNYGKVNAGMYIKIPKTSLLASK